MEWFISVWDILPPPMRDKLETYVDGFWTILPNLAIGAFFLVVVWVFATVVRLALSRVLKKANLRQALIDVIMMIAISCPEIVSYTNGSLPAHI